MFQQNNNISKNVKLLIFHCKKLSVLFGGHCIASDIAPVKKAWRKIESIKVSIIQKKRKLFWSHHFSRRFPVESFQHISNNKIFRSLSLFSKNTDNIRRSLDLIEYFCGHIKNFSKLAKLIYELTKETQKKRE